MTVFVFVRKEYRYDAPVEALVKVERCPFCRSGGELVVLVLETKFSYVYCRACEARGPKNTDPKLALDRWCHRIEEKTHDSKKP